MKKLHFALIGAGKHGTRWEGVLKKHAYLDAVVDPNRKDGVTLKSVLNNKNIDAVLIATPHIYHYSITKKVLEYGKHVLCEKPGSNTSEEIRILYTLAREKGLMYNIGYNYRYHDGFIKARALFDKDEIGDLLFIRAVHGFGGRKGYGKEWRINKNIGGGGHLHDQGVHMIDMAKSFMGEIDKVEGMRADTYWGSGTEDNAFVLLKSGKVMASIHSSLTQWKRKHTFEIYGTKGYLIIEGLGMRYGEPEKLILGKRTEDPDVVKETVFKCDPIADNSLELELLDFMSGSPSNGYEAYETLKIVEEVYKDRV